MDDTIITIYCLCEEFLKAMSHRRDDPQSRLSTAEVMAIPLVAATFFGVATSTKPAGSCMSTATRPRRSANLTSTAACMPSSPCSGGYCSSCWPKPSRSEMSPIRHTRLTL